MLGRCQLEAEIDSYQLPSGGRFVNDIAALGAKPNTLPTPIGFRVLYSAVQGSQEAARAVRHSKLTVFPIFS
jgi:hypothetical protein